MIKEIIKKIQTESGLTLSQLDGLGVNEATLTKAFNELRSKGIDNEAIKQTLFKLWEANKVKDITSHEEMELLGFKLTDSTWVHPETMVIVTEDERKVFTFTLIEAMVMSAKTK